MKRGRSSWTTKVSELVLDRINTRIDFTMDDAEAIHLALNLQQYGVAKRTFRNYVAVRRRQRAARIEAGQVGPPGSASPQSLLQLSLDALTEAIVAKTINPAAIPSAVKAVVSLSELTLKEDAAERAEELHEIKLAQLREKMKVAIDEKTEDGAKELTRADVYDLVDKVMRGEGA